MAAKRLMRFGALIAVFGSGYLLGAGGPGAATPAAIAQSAPDVQPARVFELRTYTAAEGKMDDLLARFRNHTMRIFEKHGMTNVVYWTPQDAPLADNTLVYVLAHASREAADRSWSAFAADPEWQQVAEESQRNGRLIAGLERAYLEPTDFSPMR